MMSLQEWAKGKEEDLCDRIMTKNNVPKQQLQRMFLDGGGLSAPEKCQYCVKCGNPVINLPPMNEKIWDDIKLTIKKYITWLKHTDAYELGKYNNPLLDVKGKVLRMILTPTTKHTLISCNWCQNKPCTCQFNRNYKGKKYTFWERLICHCGWSFCVQNLIFWGLRLKRWKKRWESIQMIIMQRKRTLTFWTVEPEQVNRQKRWYQEKFGGCFCGSRSIDTFDLLLESCTNPQIWMIFLESNEG